MKNKPDIHDPEYRIFRLVHEDLPEDQARQLQQEIRQSPELVRELQQEQALSDHLEQLGRGDLEQIPQEDLELQRMEIVSSLERRVLLDGSRRKLWIHSWQAGLAAAAAVLVAVGLWMWLGTAQPSQSGPVANVNMVRAEGPQEGASLIAVSARRGLDYDVFALAPPSQQRDSASQAPAGTVMLSFGQSPREEMAETMAVPVGL
jgi:hypothetical protein